MGNQLGALDYRAVYGYIKEVSRDLHVVGNPGMPFPAVEAYLQAADTLVLFEGPLINADLFGASFAAYPTGGPYAGLPLWFRRYPRGRVANLVYGVPSAGEMRRALVKAFRYNAGYVYVTNDVLSNPWDALPTYWADEVRAIAALNTWLNKRRPASGRRRSRFKPGMPEPARRTTERIRGVTGQLWPTICAGELAQSNALDEGNILILLIYLILVEHVTRLVSGLRFGPLPPELRIFLKMTAPSRAYSR